MRKKQKAEEKHFAFTRTTRRRSGFPLALKASRCAGDSGVQGAVNCPLHNLTSRTQAGAALDQEVERGGNLIVVFGELEDLERLQLADKRRDGPEAAEEKKKKTLPCMLKNKIK